MAAHTPLGEIELLRYLPERDRLDVCLTQLPNRAYSRPDAVGDPCHGGSVDRVERLVDGQVVAKRRDEPSFFIPLTMPVSEDGDALDESEQAGIITEQPGLERGLLPYLCRKGRGKGNNHVPGRHGLEVFLEGD